MESQRDLYLRQKGIDLNKPTRFQLNRVIDNIEDDDIAQMYKDKFISLRDISIKQLTYLWAIMKADYTEEQLNNLLKDFIINLK